MPRLYVGDECPQCGDPLMLGHTRSIVTLFKRRPLLQCQMCNFVVKARRRRRAGDPYLEDYPLDRPERSRPELQAASPFVPHRHSSNEQSISASRVSRLA